MPRSSSRVSFATSDASRWRRMLAGAGPVSYAFAGAALARPTCRREGLVVFWV